MRWALCALLAGCYSPKVAPGAPCTTTDDCPSPLRCVANVCGGTEPEPDAAMPDMSAADAMFDAATDGLVTEMLVFGDDASELRDSEVWETQPTTVQGGYDHFSIDGSEFGLLWFDLTSIPSTKTVMSATLRVTVADNADEGGGTVGVHRLREAWVESEATWNLRATGQAWSVAGARTPASDAVPVATFTPAAVETAYDIVLPPALVQEWITTPAINYGVVFAPGTSTEHVHVHSRESGVWSVLTVEIY